MLDEVQRLYQAGADYVVLGRLTEADELLAAIDAAECGLIEDKRAELEARLAGRRQVLPSDRLTPQRFFNYRSDF